MRRAVIRLGPLITPDVWEDRTLIREDRWYYASPHTFELLPYDKSRLLIDHDLDGPSIGRIDELVRWSDGDGEWLAARAALDDDAPDWVRQGTAASIGFVDTISEPFGAGVRMGAGRVTEVSLLSPSERPRDPMARVVLLREVLDPWDLPPKTLAELGPVCETNALQHWTARMELGEDSSRAFADIKAKLAEKRDPRLGRRTNIQSQGHAGRHDGRQTLIRRYGSGTILGIR